MPQVFRRDAVVRLVDRDVAIAACQALRLLEVRKAIPRQRAQRGPLALLESFRDLLARGAMDACVGGRRFPTQQELVLLRQRLEGACFQRVLLDVVDASLHLALVTWHPRLGGQQHRAVMLAEALQFRIQVRIVPVGSQHSRLEIVGDKRLGDAAEVQERVLQA